MSFNFFFFVNENEIVEDPMYIFVKIGCEENTKNCKLHHISKELSLTNIIIYIIYLKFVLVQ